MGETVLTTEEVYAIDCDSRYTIYDTMLERGRDIPILQNGSSIYEYSEELQSAVCVSEDVTVYSIKGFASFSADGNGASVYGDDNKFAAIAFEVTLGEGQMFTFDYFASEFGGETTIYVDGNSYDYVYGNAENSFVVKGDINRTYRILVICKYFSSDNCVVTVSNAHVR